MFQSSPARGGGCNPTHSRMRGGYHRFQSSPARGGGCNESHAHTPTPLSHAVSILTRPWGRVQPHASRLGVQPVFGFNPHPPVGAGATGRYTIISASTQGFQSSPARGGGCNTAAQRLLAAGVRVSILTRPWGRVQRTRSRKSSKPSTFQSSPARGGGCNGIPTIYRVPANPVSILTRPWGRVQRNIHITRQVAKHVSILTRPWGRVQRPVLRREAIRPVGFNPHPPVGAGATGYWRWTNDQGVGVSILTRPWGRVQLAGRRIWTRTGLFQSSPACGGGCNVIRCWRLLWRFASFNPHPPVGAGATPTPKRA